MENKLKSLTETISWIQDGDTVAVGSQAPMAIVREIIKQGKKDLIIYPIIGSMDVDLLCGAGCLREVHTVMVVLSMSTGLWAPNYRRTVQTGKVKVREESELTLVMGILAGSLALPFIPVRGWHSDFTKLHPEWKRFTSPLADEELLAIPAIVPDVAIMHMPRADACGNVQGADMVTYDRIAAWWDRAISQAAKKVIVSVEDLVDTTKIRENPENTWIPFYDVDAIIKIPKGSHPCGFSGYYVEDVAHVQLYAEASQDEGSFNGYLEKYIYNVQSHSEFLTLTGAK